AITRNFLEFADSVPGVQFTVDGNGNTSFRGGAQEDTNVNVFIDGVSMKDFVQGGLSGQSGAGKNPNQGDPGNPFPQSAIDEYKVINSNYKAEYDQLASAAITAQTKSGTNTFKGDVFGTFTNSGLRADTPAEVAATTAGNPKADAKTYEWGVSAGGPIIQDRMHYFAAFERKSLSLPNVVYPSSQSGLTAQQAAALLPGGVGSQFGPTTNPFTENLFFGKLDYEPSESDRLELWNLYRDENQLSGASGQTGASAATKFANKNNRITLRWQHFGDNWLNEARIAYQDATSAPEASSTRPQYIYNYLTNTGPQTLIAVNGGTAWQQFANSQKGTTFEEAFTLNKVHWLGDHTVKAGIKYTGIDLKYQDAGQGMQFNYIVDGSGTSAQPYSATYTLTNPGKSNVATSSDKQYGIYLQDDWKIDQHWTANIGVRWDYEKVPSWEDFALPQPIVDSINGPYSATNTSITYANALALGGINIGNFIGNGHNRKTPSDQFQPRLGISYDINGDQRHVVFGGYGRSYDRNIYDLLSLELTKSALSEPSVNFYGTTTPGGAAYGGNGCLTAANASPGTCVAWDPTFLTSLSALQGTATTPYGEIDLINNKIKNPYSDQFTVGIRNTIGEWNSSVAISQINSYNRLVGFLGNRLANGSFLANCGWGTAGMAPAWCVQSAPSIATGNLVLWDNGARDRNTSVLVALEKPYTRESGWSAHFAYTYSNAYQSDYYAYSGNNQYQFDYPNPKQFPLVPSSAVAKHRLVVTGSLDGKWGIVWSGKIALATPVPYNTSSGCPTLASPGCNGNWVYPISDRPRDLFGEHSVDIAAQKNWELKDDMKAYFRLDVLNVFNTAYYDPAGTSWNFTYGAPSPPPKFNTTGPILGVPFTLKLSAGFGW
ncbi:MAG: TonB-dependent receptor, partial [Gammaproteobacteria bacterium]|nr:TonB-dependent receptor [Gammaproteobacteria bacterium]